MNSEREILKRLLESSNRLKESYYFIGYTYDGDNLSDYTSTCIVKANSENEAITKAKRLVNVGGARSFHIDTSRGNRGKLDNLQDYKMKFPHSNINIYEDASILPDDEDTIVRSEHHPITTADKPNIEENNLPNNTNEPNNINETNREV